MNINISRSQIFHNNGIISLMITDLVILTVSHRFAWSIWQFNETD
jgi:hypothetical protein